MSSVIGSLLGQECREARQLPTLSDGVVLRVRQASSVTLVRHLPNQEIDVQKILLPMIGILTAALACG